MFWIETICSLLTSKIVSNKQISISNVNNIVLNKLRSQLSARGANTIRGFSKSFQLFDSYNGNRKVDPQEFFVGLRENGLNVTKQEADVRNISNG